MKPRQEFSHSSMPNEGRPLVVEDSGVRLPESFHSRYDPLKEASRHVESCLGGKHPSLVFILGGGLNYIGVAVKKIFPHTRIVLLQPSQMFDAREVCPVEYRWSPSSQRTLGDIVREALQGEHIAGGVSIIEWNPVMQAFPEIARSISNTLRIALEITSSRSATSSFWAYRWLKNSIRFAMNINKLAIVETSQTPIVLVCAGPTLSQYYEKIRAIRDTIKLWSLASASLALRHHGLIPDLVLATDPGFWNSYHLYDSQESSTPVALTPSAYSPASVIENSAIVPLYTGLEFERIALETLDTKIFIVDASGSSAGTALSLALSSSLGEIFIIGLDLAAYGSDDHACPYAFDILSEKISGRLNPEISLRYSRIFDEFTFSSPPWRTTRQFSAYAQTINTAGEHRTRVFRYSDSPIELDIAKPEFPLEALQKRPKANTSTLFINNGMDKHTRQKSLLEGFSAAIERASSDARHSIESHRPMNFNTALMYRAFAGKKAAETIANTARGCAELNALITLDAIVRDTLDEVIRI
jgi:hypothetical protein